MATNLFSRFLSVVKSRNKRRSARRRKNAVLAVETLEDRIAPVVGQTAIPAPVIPGATQYDGVALVEAFGPNGGSGTGALIASGTPGQLDGHYILTAAHVNPDIPWFPIAPGLGLGAVIPTGGGPTLPGRVTFNLERDRTPVNVYIPCPPS